VEEPTSGFPLTESQQQEDTYDDETLELAIDRQIYPQYNDFSNDTSQITNLDVQRMRGADSLHSATEQTRDPARPFNSNRVATTASPTTDIPPKDQQILAPRWPEELNEATTKLPELMARLNASNIQAGRPMMPTQTDSQMRHSLPESSFPAYPTKDDTVKGIDELLDLLQTPTSPIDFLEERNTASAIMQNLRGRHLNGLLDPEEAKALNSSLQGLYRRYYLYDRKEMAYWAAAAIGDVMNVTPERYSYPYSVGLLAISRLRSEYTKFLGSSRRLLSNITAPGNCILGRLHDEPQTNSIRLSLTPWEQ
jgi:hypothetical protein